MAEASPTPPSPPPRHRLSTSLQLASASRSPRAAAAAEPPPPPMLLHAQSRVLAFDEVNTQRQIFSGEVLLQLLVVCPRGACAEADELDALAEAGAEAEADTEPVAEAEPEAEAVAEAEADGEAGGATPGASSSSSSSSRSETIWASVPILTYRLMWARAATAPHRENRCQKKESTVHTSIARLGSKAYLDPTRCAPLNMQMSPLNL